MKTVKVGDQNVQNVTIGPDAGLVLIAGPCVIESRDLCFQIAEYLKDLTDRLAVPYIFKASFDKANRTSIDSFRGPGLQTGLQILDEIRTQLKIPVVSDIHLPAQAPEAADVLDIIQIPAFLCRQTDLVESAAATGKCVQLKKAQVMAPQDMKNVVAKVTAHDNQNITLVERGTFFGYNRLVCDMAAIPALQQIGYPTLIDATHSTQQPGALGAASGGSPQLALVLARSAVAAGADGLFIEAHPDPANALSDAPCMLALTQMENLIKTCKQIYQTIRTK